MANEGLFNASLLIAQEPVSGDSVRISIDMAPDAIQFDRSNTGEANGVVSVSTATNALPSNSGCTGKALAYFQLIATATSQNVTINHLGGSAFLHLSREIPYQFCVINTCTNIAAHASATGTTPKVKYKYVQL